LEDEQKRLEAQLKGIEQRIKVLLSPLTTGAKVEPRPWREIDIKVDLVSVTLSGDGFDIATIRLEDFQCTVSTQDDGCSNVWLIVNGLVLRNEMRLGTWLERALEPLQASTEPSARLYYKRSGCVGGIPIFDHFEITVAPVAVRLTREFYINLHAFLLPTGHETTTVPIVAPEVHAFPRDGRVAVSTRHRRQLSITPVRDEHRTSNPSVSHTHFSTVQSRARWNVSFPFVKIGQVS